MLESPQINGGIQKSISWDSPQVLIDEKLNLFTISSKIA
jgi:hypothetical protein